MANRMTLQNQALALGAGDRAAIASALLHSLEPPSYDVSDEEVLNRLKQFESGEVKEISHESLMAQVKRPSSR